MTEFEKLRQIIQSEVEISDLDLDYFLSLWKTFPSKKKEIITACGEIEKYLYFVASGIQRIYYLDEQNREATIVFTYKNSFGGVLDSFLLQNPSKYYFETLSHSEFLRISHVDLQNACKKIPILEIFIQKGLSQTLSGILDRLVELQCFSSEEKFKKLLQRSPHILQLVPQKYLANYLGIDPTNFSKLINHVQF